MKISFDKIKIALGLSRPSRYRPPARVDEAGIDETLEVIDEFMLFSKPFLQSHYSLYQLCEETGLAIFDLTVILDNGKFSCFKDFMDHYRIAYCKKIMEQMPLNTITLTDLSILCGFSDQQDFCTAFKKAERVSVARYVCNTCRERLSGGLPAADACAVGLREANFPDI